MNRKEDTSESDKRVAFQVRLFSETPQSEDALPTEIQVIPTGEWDHPIWGNMKINEDDIAQFVENFRKGIRKAKIPITAGHSVMEELPAIGWFTDVIDRGKEGLWGAVEWTEKGKELLLEGAYKYFSPEYFPVYEDAATGQKHKNVLSGGALTNHPFFRELKDVVAFSEPQIIKQSIQSMTIEEILAKPPEDRSDEEIAFLDENKDDFTDEQRAQLDTESGADDGDDAGDDTGNDAGDDDGDSDGEGADDGAGEGVQASHTKDGMVQMSAAQYKALTKKADEGSRAFAEVEKMKVSTQVKKLTFSSANPEGRLLPKQEEATTKFMMSLDATGRDQFINIINNMPKHDFSEVETGDGGDSEASVDAEVEAKVNEEMKASECSYSDAVRKVFSENPELEARYNEAHPAE